MAKERTACDDGEGNTKELDGSFLTLGLGCSTENTEAPVDPGSNADVSGSGRINSETCLTLGVEGNSDVENSTRDYISNIDNPERVLYDSVVKSTQGDKNNVQPSADFGVTTLKNAAARPGPSSDTTSGSGVREDMPIRTVDSANFNENMDRSHSAVGTNYSDSGSNADISGRKHHERFLTFDKYCADIGYDLRRIVDTAYSLNSLFGADLGCDLRGRVDTAHSLNSGADLGYDLRGRVDTSRSLNSGADLGYDLRGRVDTAHSLNSGADLGNDLRARVDTAHSLSSGTDLEVNYGLGSGPSSSTGLAIGARPSRSSQMGHTTSEQSQQTSGVGVSVMPPPMGSTSPSDAQIHGNCDIPTPLPLETTLKRVTSHEYLSSPVPYKKRLMQQEDFTFLIPPPPKPELPYQNLWPPVADERAGNLSFSNNINQTYPPNHPQASASLPPPPPNACRPPSSKRPCDYCYSSETPPEATIEDCGHKYHINCLRKSSKDVGGKCFKCESSKI